MTRRKFSSQEVEELLVTALREASALGVVRSLVQRHRDLYNAEPSMVLVTRQLHVALCRELHRVTGLTVDLLLAKTLYLGPVPIIIGSPNGGAYVEIYGDRPAQFYSV